MSWRDPLDAFAPLATEPYAALLYGGSGRRARPDRAHIFAFPSRTLEARGDRLRLDGVDAGAGFFPALAALHRARPRTPRSRATGLAGYIGYELGGELEPSAAGPPSPYRLPDAAIGAYDATATFDLVARRARIVAQDQWSADRLAEALGRPAPEPSGSSAGWSQFSPPQSNFSAAAYEAAVCDAIARIRRGAFFQVNLAQRLTLRSEGPCAPFDVFRRLAGDLAPFAAFLAHAEGCVLSNSPERFFSARPDAAGSKICAEPIKGTRARSPQPKRDAEFALELAASAKDRAENIMIADLTRNDLSRICALGSIQEEGICELQSFGSVHHLVSRISGRLAPGLDATDALAALFPCGSITGAPKIEAMRTIGALEASGRGPYCGAIGFIDDDGGADFSVAIRTMIAERQGDRLAVAIPVGGGVTLRSDPAAERRETLVKARASLRALGVAGDDEADAET